MTQLPLIDDQEVEMPRNSEGTPFSGPRLIMARHRRGYTPADLAYLLHLPRPTIIGFFFAEGQRLINPESVSWCGRPWVWDADNMHERKWIDQH